MLGYKFLIYLLTSIATAEGVVPTTTVSTTNYYYSDANKNPLGQASTTITTTIGEIEYISANLPDTTTTLYYYDGAPGEADSLTTHYVENSEFQTATLEVHIPPIITSTITHKPCAAGIYTSKNSDDQGILMVKKEQIEGNSFTLDVSTVAGVSSVHHNIESDNINLNLIGTSLFNYIGYFAPKDAGWYEFKVDALYSLPIIQIGTPESGDWVTVGDGTFSFFFYADGTNNEGLTASYPVVLSLEVLLDATLGVYKNGKLLNFDDIFFKDDVSPTTASQYLSSFNSALSAMPTICENQPTTVVESQFTDDSNAAQSTTLSNSEFDSVTILVQAAATTTTSVSSHSTTFTSTSNPSNSTISESSMSTSSTLSSSPSIEDSISTTSEYWSESYTATTTETLFDSNGKSTQLAVVLIPEASNNFKEGSSIGNSTFTNSGFLGTISIEVSSYSTEIITITSCAENRCSLVTRTTTYCPLTGSSNNESSNTENNIAPTNTRSQSFDAESTATSNQESSLASSISNVALEIPSSITNENAPVIQQSENAALKSISFSVFTGIFCSIVILQFI